MLQAIIAALIALASGASLYSSAKSGAREERMFGKKLQAETTMADKTRQAEERAMKEKSSMAQMYDRQAMQLAERNRQERQDTAMMEQIGQSGDRQTAMMASLLSGLQGQSAESNAMNIRSLTALLE